MKTVKQVLSNKQVDIFSVNASTSVRAGLQFMMEKNISALLVMEDGELSGIFTERDYARKIVLVGRSSADTPVLDVMTPDPITVSINDTIDHCMEIMTNKHIRHLPVMENGKLYGMLSIGDVVKFIIADQKATITQLESYISG